MTDHSIFEISDEISREGVAVCVLVAREIDNTAWHPTLTAYREKSGASVSAFWQNRSVSSHPAIREYHRLHTLFGIAEEKSSAEFLLSIVQRNRDFTKTNPLVDCYNIVSAETLISIGAHDLEKITLPITMRTLGPDDVYVPLNETEPRRVDGEYGFVDHAHRVICRADIKQADFSKTTADTRDAMVILQDNRALKGGKLLNAARMVSELLTTFCGTRCEVVAYCDRS